MSTNLHDVLNSQVANWTVLFMKLHNYHWYVKGVQFFTLHQKFEELYNEAATHIDDLAERLLAIGGRPVATLAEVLQKASIKEASNSENPEQMVESIVNDFTHVISGLKTGIEMAVSVNDKTTEDLLLSITTGLEKQVWLLKAFLGK